MLKFWHSVRDYFESAMVRCAGVKKYNDFQDGIYTRCYSNKETKLINYIKYCVKTRTLELITPRYYTIPPVAVLAGEVFSAFCNNQHLTIDKQGKLYRHWLIFN